MDMNKVNHFIENYETLNVDMLSLIKETYLKYYLKAFKQFKIIVVGYNACPNKDLKVFEKYGWKYFAVPTLNRRSYECWFTYKPTSKISVTFRQAIREDGSLYIMLDIPLINNFIEIYVDKTDENFEFIKQFVNYKPDLFYSRYGGMYGIVPNYCGDEELRYTVTCMGNDQCKLTIAYLVTNNA